MLRLPVITRTGFILQVGGVLDTDQALLLRATGRLCALPVARVEETMRRQPVTSLTELPPFVRGLAVIRGSPTPVVNLSALLTGHVEPGDYFVTLRVGRRLAVLEVDVVLGVRALGAQGAHTPLLSRAVPEFVQALEALDDELVFVLNTGFLMPESTWRRLEAVVEAQDAEVRQ